MKKKILALVMIGVMVFCLTGCGGVPDVTGGMDVLKSK